MVITSNPLLSAFERVGALGSAHSAAKSLGLTQAAITKRIHALEDQLRVTLFLRSRRGMTLTDEGKVLLQLCKEGRELEGQFMAQIKGAQHREITLSILGPTSAISTRVARNCESVYRNHPYLRLHLQSDDHSDLIERLRRGEGDLAIIPPDLVPDEMDSKLLKADRYLLVAMPRWKGRRVQNLLESERIIDFNESDGTTMRYLRAFGLDEFVKRPRIFVNENEALIRLFKVGVGLGTLTETVAEPHLGRGELVALNQGRAMEDPLALVWFPRRRMPDYLAEVIRVIK